MGANETGSGIFRWYLLKILKPTAEQTRLCGMTHSDTSRGRTMMLEMLNSALIRRCGRPFLEGAEDQLNRRIWSRNKKR